MKALKSSLPNPFPTILLFNNTRKTLVIKDNRRSDMY